MSTTSRNVHIPQTGIVIQEMASIPDAFYSWSFATHLACQPGTLVANSDSLRFWFSLVVIGSGLFLSGHCLPVRWLEPWLNQGRLHPKTTHFLTMNQGF